MCVLVVEFFQELAVTLIQCVLRNTKAKARFNTSGETRVGKWVLDIDVGNSTVARDYRCVCLSGLVLRGYLLSQEAS